MLQSKRVLPGFDRALEQVPIPVLQIDSINGLHVSNYESGSAATDSFTMASLGPIHQSQPPLTIFKCRPINMLLKVLLNITTHRYVSLVLCCLFEQFEANSQSFKMFLQNPFIPQITSCQWTSSQHHIYGH